MTTKLRNLRIRYHITLDEFAAAVGVSNQYLSALEQRKTFASKKQKARISTVFAALAQARSAEIQSLDAELRKNKNFLFEPIEVRNDEP